MDWTRRFLERVTPQSAFGLTLVTILTMVFIVVFFAHGIYLVSIEGAPADGSSPFSDRDLVRWPSSSSVRVGAGESCRVGAVNAALADDADEEEEENNNSSLVSASPRIAGLNQNNPTVLASINRGDRNVGKVEKVENRTVAPGCVALLNRTCDCRWSDEEGPADGAQFKVGQTIKIAAGLAEIIFGCGAKAILEGPAEFKLQSNKGGELASGKITADVPDEIEGFAVNTPTARVITLCSASGKESKAVAKLTAASNCQWAEGNAVTKEGECLKSGQSVKLVSGLAEITFQNGAKVILEGPANLEIESEKTARLHNGRMTADVPDELEGFKINTAVAEILSLPAESKESKQPKGTSDAKDKSPTV